MLGVTPHPTSAWVAKTARNLVMDIEDTGCQVKYLIRDRDGKYPALFDKILADAGTTLVLSGVRTPRTNSIMERWIQASRDEVHDRTLIVNQTHLLYAPREYERHRNDTGHTGASRTHDPCEHYPTRLPSQQPSHVSTSANPTDSSFTNTSMPLDQHG